MLIPDDQQGNPETYIEKYFPDWTVKEVDNRVTPIQSIVVQENPAFKSYTEIVNLDPWEVKGKTVYGYVISRSVASGQIYVDDERLANLDSDLYSEVTEWENSDLIYLLGLSDEQLEGTGWPRLVKSPDDLTPAQVEKLKPYLYPAPSTAKLLVRYAKEDESNEA